VRSSPEEWVRRPTTRRSSSGSPPERAPSGSTTGMSIMYSASATSGPGNSPIGSATCRRPVPARRWSPSGPWVSNASWPRSALFSEVCLRVDFAGAHTTKLRASIRRFSLGAELRPTLDEDQRPNVRRAVANTSLQELRAAAGCQPRVSAFRPTAAKGAWRARTADRPREDRCYGILRWSSAALKATPACADRARVRGLRRPSTGPGGLMAS